MTNNVKYLVIYKCAECGEESSFTDIDEPTCKYCDHATTMTLISKQEITPELMEERIKALSASMLTNLQQAYQHLTEEEKSNFPEGQDAEKEMLMLLAKVKNLKDKIDGIKFDDKDENSNPDR
ncbi:MAG: hypothetical protein ABI772_14165 [Bacteroidota bacterium]